MKIAETTVNSVRLFDIFPNQFDIGSGIPREISREICQTEVAVVHM